MYHTLVPQPIDNNNQGARKRRNNGSTQSFSTMPDDVNDFGVFKRIHCTHFNKLFSNQLQKHNDNNPNQRMNKFWEYQSRKSCSSVK